MKTQDMQHPFTNKVNLRKFSQHYIPKEHVYLFSRLPALARSGSVLLFARVEEAVVVFPHVIKLTPESQYAQENEISQQKWPEHRQIENS